MNDTTRLRAIVYIAKEIDELFEQFFETAEMPPVWSPALDLFVSDSKVHLMFAVPGVRAEDMEVRIGPRSVVVRGTKAVPASVRQGVSFYESELPYGPFEKRVALPAPVLPQSYRVGFADGVLTLELERAATGVRMIRVE